MPGIFDLEALPCKGKSSGKNSSRSEKRGVQKNLAEIRDRCGRRDKGRVLLLEKGGGKRMLLAKKNGLKDPDTLAGRGEEKNSVERKERALFSYLWRGRLL